MRMLRPCLLALSFFATISCAGGDAVAQAEKARIDFTRDIRPLLVDHCFECHGPDAATREAELRLDVKSDLFTPRTNGETLLVSGNREASSLFQRLVTEEAKSQMPPPEAGNPLSTEQKELIGRWIDEGAVWRGHWAYEPPRRPPLPTSDRPAWANNAIDVFSYAKMKSHSLRPSREADGQTLVRRVTLDLTGLPPTAAEIDDFLSDTAPDAYLRLVDRLLQSPRFGERMATHWLDLARYADTHGYHMDAHRDMWRWRDWVIAAYNDNMPFDQFTVEQLAGDLLPKATLSQRIATGFNRNNMVNFENGAIAEEYLTEYAIDRVTTTSTVWLGQTMTCARCHDHKYDPFTQRDFYRLLAFFNQVAENGVDGNQGNAAPFIAAPLTHQVERMKGLKQRLASLAATQQQQTVAADAAVTAWEMTRRASDTRTISSKPQLTVGFDRSDKVLDDAIHGPKIFVPGKIDDALLFNSNTRVDLGDQAALVEIQRMTISVWVFPTTPDAVVIVERRGKHANDPSYSIELDGGKVSFRLAAPDAERSVRFTTDAVIAPRTWQHVVVRFDGSKELTEASLFVNGTLQPATKTDEPPSNDSTASSSFVIGSLEAGRSFRGMMDDLRFFSTTLTDEDIAIVAGGDPIGDILAVASAERTNQQTARLKRYYLEQIDESYRKTLHKITATKQSLRDLRMSIPTTMVMQDVVERKPTSILNRGRYDSPGEIAEPGIPNVLSDPASEAITNRLLLARWLVESDHPLTARVAVNHLWQLFFGAGLVRTPEDFGTRGEPPTHPELLDWLATEFASDWDVKRLVRLLVTSAAYRQSSHTTPELTKHDPENRWLARASRMRLSAEMVRDGALFASGLLVERAGGPSVFPYQPDGLWEEIAYNANDFTAQVYRQSQGADLYRRSLYTFVKRSLPSPTLAAFDAPNRETCVVQRQRTNTPQQALVLMNDVTFVEAARALAERTLATTHTTERRINAMFRTANSRSTNASELKVFDSLVRDLRQRYEGQPDLAKELNATGNSPASRHINPIDLAVWTAVANVILSLDEAITRP
ncbi:MAG: DUF1553 domain-containing protein [Planctomycetes bacterium]|nr:DUF1553 domain-containing protein [Planctomycetota bacterium]